MSKQNSLPDFLADLADGIRTAEGSTAPINPQDFRSRVEALPNSGGGGESGVPIKVATLPTPSADTVGKVYLLKQGITPKTGDVLGNKLYFDTTKNPLDYENNTSILGDGGNFSVAIWYTNDDRTECTVIVLINGTLSNVVYAHSSVRTVEEYRTYLETLWGSFASTVTHFGWLTDEVDTSSIAGTTISVGEAAELAQIKRFENYYVGNQSTEFVVGEPVGDKIYFDTTKNPVDYVEYMNTCLIGMSNGTNTYYLSMKDILAAQGVTGYGHCYAMAVSTADMSSILGIAYIYCDVLSVAQFNSMIGASFGVSITQFGWQTNVLPISAVADYEVTTNNLADWDYLAYGEPRFDIENERDALIEDNVSKIVSSAKSIRPHAFYASKIAYANFSNATSIGTNAFTVSEIVKAYFPNVTYIGSDAFTNCLRLRNISLPKVEKIEARAFRACYNLKSITIGTITPPTIGAGDVNHPFTDCTALTAIYVPAESVEAYKTAQYWSEYADIIQAIA